MANRREFEVPHCTQCGEQLEHSHDGDPDAPLVPWIECERECGYLVDADEGEVPGVEWVKYIPEADCGK